MRADREPTLVALENSVFKRMGECLFFLDEKHGEPVMSVTVGANQCVLPFQGLIREFRLSESDIAMLGLLAEGLRFVRGLKVGDALPSEVVTGEASWELSQKHYIVAHQRVVMQLVNWLAGIDRLVTSPDELMQLADDPANRKRVSEAFGEAAERMGIGREHKEQMVQYVEKLAKELAYVEALRDKFGTIEGIQKKVDGIRQFYMRERSILQTIDQVRKLLLIAVADLSNRLTEIDAQTGEIIAVLKNLENQVLYIREKRDELYVRMRAWDDLIEAWKVVPVAASMKVPDLMAKLYQFLAARFMKTDEWVLMTKLQTKSQPLDDLIKKKKVLVW